MINVEFILYKKVGILMNEDKFICSNTLALIRTKLLNLPTSCYASSLISRTTIGVEVDAINNEALFNNKGRQNIYILILFYIST